MNTPDGFLNESVENKRCPMCGLSIAESAIYEDIALMSDPPRQVERYSRLTRWQCLRYEEHNGEYRVPAARASMSDDELIAGVLRRILHDPARHEAQEPLVMLGENELLIDGRIGITDDEQAALLRARRQDAEGAPPEQGEQPQ